jgi:hyperosmotically inducible periplasmic protein
MAVFRSRGRRRGARLRSAGTALASAIGGAVAAFFLDPRSGRRRRHTARDRVLSRARRTERRAVVGARRAEWRLIGAGRRMVSARRPSEPPDDVTLAQKVASTLFRDPSVPKGSININAEAGVVFLRGMVESETIPDIEQAARRVPGVRDVENLLHPPGTPAPASRPKSIREQAHN